MSHARHHSQAVRSCLTILAVMPGAGHVSPDEEIDGRFALWTGAGALGDYNLAIYTQVKPNAKRYTQILNIGTPDIVARQKIPVFIYSREPNGPLYIITALIYKRQKVWTSFAATTKGGLMKMPIFNNGIFW
jgi:hypothetical protein